MKPIISIFFYLIASLLYSSEITNARSIDAKNTINYVKSGAAGDCASWTTACELETALTQVESGEEIWVAAGTYIPTTAEDPNDAFQLKSGVALYGGFPPEGSDWGARNWETNVTILSGDFSTGRSYHVVSSDEVDETAILDGFVISNGNAIGNFEDGYGGGMYNANSSPTLTNIIFSNNYANFGGGMANSSSNPILTNITFSDNTAALSGGGMHNQDSGPILSDVTFTTNSAANKGGGMANTESSPTLNNVTFSDNLAAICGGMFNSFSNPTLTDVTFSDNADTWGYGGAGMRNENGNATLTRVIFSGNTSPGGHGGGMSNDWSDTTLTDVEFSNNSAARGGGLSHDIGNATLINVSFSNNTAIEDGGGMYSNTNDNTVTLTNVIFSDNSAGDDGGGMCNDNDEGTTSLNNVTFSNNSAVEDGGGMYNYSDYSYTGGILLDNVTFSANSAGDEGGGMSNESRNASLSNITFTGNSAPYGGGLYVYYSATTITNAIIWGNTDNQIYINSPASVTATYSAVEGGYTGTGNINLDPLLGVLADNGGFTMTHAILFGSPAIDTGSPSICSSTDQRGYPRPYDGNNNGTAVCDMGAFEVQPYTLTITTTGNGVVNVNPDQATYDYGDEVTLTAIADPDWTFTNWSGDASSVLNPLTFNIHGNTTISAIFNKDLLEIYLPLIIK